VSHLVRYLFAGPARPFFSVVDLQYMSLLLDSSEAQDPDYAIGRGNW
jgi:hypothetical protein